MAKLAIVMFALGLGLGYLIWGAQPTYIHNLIRQSNEKTNPVYVLMSSFNEQVAIIHGFASNQAACLSISKTISKSNSVNDYCLTANGE